MSNVNSETREELKEKALDALQTKGININSNFSILEALSKVKQREVPCPIIKQNALTTSLMTIDDLTLKTTIHLLYQVLQQLLLDGTIYFPSYLINIPAKS